MTIVDPVATYARSAPGDTALVDLDSARRWTYAELNAATNRLATWIVAELGEQSRARVATLAKNCAEMLILQHAAVRAGAIFVPLNWRLAESEVAQLIADADPAILFRDADAPSSGTWPRTLPIDSVVELGTADSVPPPTARRPFDDTSTLLYTSGTSGLPKGVMVSESNAFWGCANFIYANGVGPHSVFLCDMPLFHTAGLFAAARVPIQAGATVLISKGFDAPTTLARLVDLELGVTNYFSVPQMAAWLWEEPAFDPAALQKLECWAIGGAPHPRTNAERFINAKIRIADGFGMSEICSGFGMPPHDLEVLAAKAGSCGPAFMSVETRIVDDVGQDLPTYAVGELWLRGPSITSGYWNNPTATAAAFQDGWFKTGDACYLDDDGYLFVADRKKDMFISGGENVYPAEVEAILAQYPGIAQCAVIGVPDDRWGEVGRAFVVPANDATISVDKLLAHCTDRLAKFKVPKSVEVTDTLPRTASGKVQKHLLQRDNPTDAKKPQDS